MLFKDISIYFQPKLQINKGCADSKPCRIQQPPTNDPDFDLDKCFNHFINHKHLELHEICITFNNKWIKMNSLLLHNHLRKYIQSFMAKNKGIKPWYVFMPEFSNSGRLHYHGIIYFDNANDYWISEFKRLLRNRYGRTEGKKIFCLDNYIAYIRKDEKKDIGNIQPYYYIGA